jgi:hypothetical protein
VVRQLLAVAAADSDGRAAFAVAAAAQIAAELRYGGSGPLTPLPALLEASATVAELAGADCDREFAVGCRGDLADEEVARLRELYPGLCSALG